MTVVAKAQVQGQQVSESVFKLLRALHPDGFRDMRLFDCKKKDNSAERVDVGTFPAHDLAAVAAVADRARKHSLNAYFGVATRTHENARGLRDCGNLHALFCDFDFKDGQESRVAESLKGFPFPPSAVVESGNGLHVYWFLDKPIDLQKDAAQAKAILQTLATKLGADMASAEPARILRLPDTLNYKYDPPECVALEFIDDKRRYTLADIVGGLGPLVEAKPIADAEVPVAHGLSPEERTNRAKAWLATQEPAIEGKDGDPYTFHICAAVAIGHDLTEDQAFAALKDWNARCQPPWTDQGLRQKIRNGIKYGTGARGARLKDSAATGSSVALISAADIVPRKLEWLWFARLAKGAITLLEGAPEKGKSTILADLAARKSRGISFPGDTTGQEPGNVVMLIAEDDIRATVVPRLMAADADLKRIFFLDVTRDEKGLIVPFHLSDDCDRLRSKCREVNAVLVIVDPLVSYMGSRRGKTVNTSNDLETRKALGPLKQLAEDLDASVVAIRHYKKGKGTDALEAGGGSVAFTALVRVLLAALPDPHDPDRYLFAVPKNNLVPKEKRPTFSYRIVPSDHDPDIGRIQWGEIVQMSANEILTAEADKESDRGAGAMDEACAFLVERLSSGDWVLQEEIYKAAKAADIKQRTLERAKKKLFVESRPRNKKWCWRLKQQQTLPGAEGSGATGEI
jgi:putative DNA primase/helicase